MLRQLFSTSRSPSPSFNETIEPEFFENHPAYSTLSHFNTIPAMGEYVPMPSQGVGAVLQNSDTEKKLEFIQKLKKLGVDKYVDLPQVSFLVKTCCSATRVMLSAETVQLVVVGDQSSGKSSVLQAITRLPFPVDEKMCTRFATEVALQRSAGPESISVQIKMASTTTDGDSEDEDSETARVLECHSFPFGTPEFAQEFERVLKVVSHEFPRLRSCSDIAFSLRPAAKSWGPTQIVKS